MSASHLATTSATFRPFELERGQSAGTNALIADTLLHAGDHVAIMQPGYPLLLGLAYPGAEYYLRLHAVNRVWTGEALGRIAGVGPTLSAYRRSGLFTRREIGCGSRRKSFTFHV
jgi:hypothetical protein